MRTRNRLRKTLIAWVASYLVALTSVIGVMAPVSSAAADIGLSVTCHSEGGDTQQGPSPAPHLKCDHCAVCSFAPAVNPLGTTALTIVQTDVGAWLSIAYAAVAVPAQTTSHQARAPPRHA